MLELDEEGVAFNGHAWILFLLETFMVIIDKSATEQY